jgi:hypothetical protein
MSGIMIPPAGWMAPISVVTQSFWTVLSVTVRTVAHPALKLFKSRVVVCVSPRWAMGHKG